MVARDQVGKTAAESHLVIQPALPGRFEWTSTGTGIYRNTEAPKFDSSYIFSLRAGLKDLQGRPLAASRLKDSTTEKFRIVEQYPRWFDETDLSRMPRFSFEFNDSVTPEAVTAGMAFKCGETNERIPVTVQLATGKDFRRHYAEPMLTWAEQVADAKPTVADDATRESAVVVQPAQPLNPGKDWVLDIAETIVNKAGTSKLGAGDNIKLGNVLPFTVPRNQRAQSLRPRSYVDIDFSRSLIADEETDEEVAAERSYVEAGRHRTSALSRPSRMPSSSSMAPPCVCPAASSCASNTRSVVPAIVSAMARSRWSCRGRGRLRAESAVCRRCHVHERAARGR